MKSQVYASLSRACQTIAAIIATTLSAHGQPTNFHTLYSFGNASKMGTKPTAGLILASDGFLYGTASEGGIARRGVIFKIHPDGSGYSVLHHFQFATNNGATPEADLLEGSDETLYGTTMTGGQASGGTLFKINKNGTGFAVLHHFGTAGDGLNPYAALIEGSDGRLYGTTYLGGTGGLGTVFRLNKDGTDYSLVHSLPSGGAHGAYIQGPVLEGPDGFLYGATSSLGTNSGKGTLFKVAKDGSDFTVLRTFLGRPLEPANVRAGLILATDGVLYGVSVNGGTADFGCVFKVGTDGQNLTVLRNFTFVPDAVWAFESLIEGQDGELYGTTLNGGTNDAGTVFRLNKNGSNFAILHHFQRGADGHNPRCKLLQAPSGELLGTTELGGSPNRGTIFSTEPTGANHRTLWAFSFDGGDAQGPNAPLVEGPDGLLYGTGSFGGAGVAGTVFRMGRDGAGYTMLRHFGMTPGDGYGLSAGVIVGSDGKLYGATESGGTNGVGTVYKMNRDGTGYQVLHHFRVGTGGQYPYAPLLQGSDGFLYGVTRSQIDGTIFKLNTNGGGFITLRYLYAPSEGDDPHFPLIEGSDGFLYGTAPVGGMFGGGTIFRIGRDGSGFAVLRHFQNAPGEGHTILAALFEASDQALYGTTSSGGLGRGTVFKINKNGTGYTVLHHFTSADRALWPYSSVVEGRDGALYGTTFINAVGGGGTVYKLNKDGSGFMLVHEFSGADGQAPRAPLLLATDSAFYGAALEGGQLGFGALFRIGHQLSLTRTNNTLQLRLAGVPGYTYTLRRSTDLQSWSTWANDTIPSTGALHFSDPAPPPGAAFYIATPFY